MKRILTLSFFAASLMAASHASAAELKLRIMETTDLHMNFLNYDYYQDKPSKPRARRRRTPCCLTTAI
jgi:2',3'-cyclic-nucleotide 2'-phosphodiesterase / 3'-nucleotidase